ncbi:MAG: NUDIX domain-containing protein [Acidimicrobiales bacterium]|nr:NUDIX domain-containing protein [Acidimicrobiales bacterium]
MTRPVPEGPGPRHGGSGFLRCSDGKVRWGLYGAAGVVFVHREADGTLTVQLQKRSAFAHEGGTWSCAGGAVEPGETWLEAGLREASEEVGAIPEPLEVLGEVTFAPASDWRYVTTVVEVPARFGDSLNFETDEVAWFPPDEVAMLDLHSGFAAAWPELLTIVRTLAGSSK